MKFKDSTIKSILLEGSYVTSEDIKKAEEYAKSRGGSFAEYLVENDLINEDVLGQAIAESFSLPYSNLKYNQPTKEQVLMIPEDLAKKFHIVVSEIKKDTITVATDDPTQEDLLSKIQEIFPENKVKISFANQEDIEALFLSYQQGINTKFAKLIEEKGRIAPEIVDTIIEDALLLRASDIHFEPQEKDLIIRFRIDGVLQEVGRIPKEYYENIINRLKVQAKLRIDEHFSPQDGAIRFSKKESGKAVDLRVSIVPTLDGEKVVIRVLSSYVRDLTLSNIGLSEELQEQIVKSSSKPFGMILVTGPTGSGKTTTLYSLIKQLNTRQVNITTIEDPVEYKIEGINQIQANSQTKLSFAQGLRSIARQDPNIIFVGEIRDSETADVAINAALTGHLLLSTFHANNAQTAIPRIIDMGVEPYLLGSTLELIIAQRLVRRVCESCKVSYNLTKSELEKYGSDVSKHFGTLRSQTLYRGKGCDVCSHTGFNGRVGIFEYLTTSPDLQDLIAKSPSTREVTDLIRKQGFKSMFEDGVEKVKLGLTTIDELLRIVAPEK